MGASLLLAVLAACASPLSAQTGSGDTIHLKFAWPSDTRARVEASRYRERVAEKADTQAIRLTYDMHVGTAANGLLVQYDDLNFGANRIAGVPQVQKLLEQLSVLSPGIVVSESGEFVRIEGVDLLKARVDSLMQPALGDRSLPPQARQVLQSLLSEEMLEASAAQEWNALVGTWAGGAFVPGEVLEAEYEEPVAFFGGAPIPMVNQFTLRGRKPCGEAETEQRCVELEMRSSPDPAAMKAFLKRFLEQLALVPSSELPAFEDLQISNQVVLLTEPATRAGEVSTQMSQLDQRQYRFTYQKP